MVISKKLYYKDRSFELRFLFLFPKHFFTQTKTLFPHPLALLSSCGGIGGERLIEGGAQAAGLAEVAAAAGVDIGDAGAWRLVLYQIGADKTVGAAGGVERGARLAKGETHLDLAAIPATVDGARREDLRAQQVIPGVGQEGVALDEGGLLVRGFASGYLPRLGGGIEQAEQLGGDDAWQCAAQVCLIEAARFDAALPDQKLGHLGAGLDMHIGGSGGHRQPGRQQRQGQKRHPVQLHDVISLLFLKNRAAIGPVDAVYWPSPYHKGTAS